MEHPPSSVGGPCPPGEQTRLDRNPLALRAMFEAPESAVLRHEIHGAIFARSSWEASGEASLVLDRFRDAGDASCCFVRLAPGEGSTRLVVECAYGLESCASGGWLIRRVDAWRPIYWIPRFPTLRRCDAQGRILTEEPATLQGFRPTLEESSIEIAGRGDASLDCTVWRFPADASGFIGA